METKNVYALISAVMADIAATGISKARNNAQQGYKFRGIDDVYNAMAPIIARHGLVIVPRYTHREQTERATAKGTPLYSVVVTGELDFVSPHDGSTHTARLYGEAMDMADKATNKAMSAAYKYACMQVFCIPTEGDNDADAVTHAPAASITAEQAANIDALATELGADKPKLLEWLRVESIAAIPASRYAEVIAALERKRAAASYNAPAKVL